MRESGQELTPANENPWYLLMTLYGEQGGEEIDWELHERNRQAWNTLHSVNTNDTLRDAMRKLGVSLPPRDAYHGQFQELAKQFAAQMMARTATVTEMDDIPQPNRIPDLSDVEFLNRLVVNGMVFPNGISLESAKFGAEFLANNTVFGREVNLQAAYATGPIQMRRSIFQQGLSLRNGSLQAELDFRGASFGNVFSAEAVVVSGDAYFTEATFHNGAMFWQSTFESAAGFSRCSFGELADFQLAQFGADARFDACFFGGHTIFRATTFFEGAFFRP